jgi:hypothetical protein
MILLLMNFEYEEEDKYRAFRIVIRDYKLYNKKTKGLS